MENKNKKTKNSGFSIAEIIIVLSIFAIIASAAFTMFNGTRNKVALEDAQAKVLNAFERARSRAATGVGTTSHGVIIEGNVISDCEGYPCEKSSASSSLTSVSTDKPNLTVIFNRLSATSSTSTIIILTNNISGATTSVEVTEEGIIEK